MSRNIHIPHAVRTIQADFDARYPGWREIVAAPTREPYDDAAHQAFKHRHREEISARRMEVTWCEVTGERGHTLVADADAEGRLQGLVCRRCRHRLLTVPRGLHAQMARFWRDYCPAHCWRTHPFVCDEHEEMADWWERAAVYSSRPPVSL